MSSEAPADSSFASVSEESANEMPRFSMASLRRRSGNGILFQQNKHLIESKWVASQERIGRFLAVRRLGSLGALSPGTAVSAIPSTAAQTVREKGSGRLIRVLFQSCFRRLRFANLLLPGARIFIARIRRLKLG